MNVIPYAFLSSMSFSHAPEGGTSRIFPERILPGGPGGYRRPLVDSWQVHTMKKPSDRATISSGAPRDDGKRLPSGIANQQQGESY